MPNDVSENPFQHLFATVSDGLILSDIATGEIVLANPAAGALYGYTPAAMVGALLERFMTPAGYAQLLAAAAASTNGTNFTATISQLNAANQPFTVEIRGTKIVFQDQPCLLSVFRDVSARIQSEQQLKQLVASRTREQATLLKISQTIASSLELKPALILEQLRMIVTYSHAVLFTLTDRELVALAARGSPQLERALPLRILLKDPFAAGAQLQRLQPSRIANVWAEEPAAQFLRSLLNEQSAAFLAGVKAWLWVPLAVKRQVIGGLGIVHQEEDFFTDHQANLVLTMANQSAIALINAQLYGQAQTAASLQERQRLAQHLHDAVNQSLFSAGLIAEVLPRLWEKDHDAGRQSLHDLRRLTRGAQAELRGLLAELRPQVLIDSELTDLLRQLGNAFTGRTNIAVTVTSVGHGALPADVQVTFYRLCQEAFNNIAKHAQANQVTIHLQYDPDRIDLVIRDDGQGFRPEQISPGHYGLSMMRERAEAAGILLTITSQPGDGTKIAMCWLVAPEATNR